MPDRMEMLREALRRERDAWAIFAVSKSDRHNRYLTQAQGEMDAALGDLLSGTWPDQEAVERGARAYAEATGYYTEFHAGLSSESADKIRAGTRAALTAALGLTVLERG